MAECFMINLLEIKLKDKMELEKFQKYQEMITPVG